MFAHDMTLYVANPEDFHLKTVKTNKLFSCRVQNQHTKISCVSVY